MNPNPMIVSMLRPLGFGLLGVLLLLPLTGLTAMPPEPRLVVLTDIGGDPDDQQSMIRLMLYANEFDLQGLIATASGTPGELKESVTKPHLIREIVEAYGKVRDNLLLHSDAYPPVEELLALVLSGNPQRGLDAIGATHDTEGSRRIITLADQVDPRPLNLTIWGGQTDLAQALWRVRNDRGADGLKSIQSKLRVYDIGDQDRIAAWIQKEFPGLFYVLSMPRPGEDRREAAFRGLYLGGDMSLASRDWMETNIRQGHGPLGALYPTRTWTAPNPHSAIKEGDTPSWFYFLELGFSDPSHPDWGGWGGRFRKEPPGWWRDAPDTVREETHVRATVWRWRPAFQSDFQARLDWCVKPRAEANHAPTVVLNGDASRSILHLKAAPGTGVRLDTAESNDPDGGRLSYRWWIYHEAGTTEGSLETSTGPTTLLKVPAGAGAGTIHVILEATDDGVPPLTSHRRAVIQVAEQTL